MANRGMKIPYKKKEGKKTDILGVLELDREPDSRPKADGPK
jgi:hypothetical protein